jgi:hypothetical protein
VRGKIYYKHNSFDMKNFWQYKMFNNLHKNSLSFLLIMTLVLNAFLPTLVKAEESTTLVETDISEPVAVAEISSGDAISVSILDSKVNTNEINTNTPIENTEEIVTSSSDSLSPNSTNTDITAEETPLSDIENSDQDELTVSLNNTATSTSDATTTANTGGNTVEADEFMTETGDTVSYVELTNVVNTNIVNSTGLIDFIHDVLGYENFDMRDIFSDIFSTLSTAETTVPCGQNICNTASLLVDLANQANIYNNISVTANTGDNSALGVGAITTGDAYASANVVNMANTNIVDSNYLLLVFNNFSDLAGSLVLPNSDFFQTFLTQNHNQFNQLHSSNTASISNNVETLSNTGDNSIEGNGTSTIVTGNATSQSHTENIINQNLINANSFSILIRVQGDWTGDIFGLPEGMSWENTSDGIRLFYNPENDNSQNSSTITNITNDANITNNVKVFALTGDNEINGNDGDSQIQTGDAVANATIMNIANTNVVGSNWINLIFNIYGNWSGDIAFGQPDLWLGLSAQGNNRIVMRPGSEMSYTYTIFNRGDVTAKNVMLESEFPLSSLNLTSTLIDSDTNDGKTIWSIGDIKAGETKEITVPAKIIDTYGQNGQIPLPFSAYVYSDQKDANAEDNSDSLMMYVGQGSKKHKPSYTFPAKFIIEKTADKTEAKAGEAVNYSVKLINRGGPIFDSLLVDTLRDSDGNIISEQTWPLDKIKNGETITITYTINLPSNIKDGIYTNTAQLVGLHGSESKKYQTPYESIIAEHKLAVGNIPQGEVLGASISICTPYLTTYPRQYRDNNLEEVIKLQNFLKQYVTKNIEVNGTFDDNTRIAVESFQQQYKDDILSPWNMTKSSGYVYYTTQKKINEIMCGDTTEFPLTLEQENEIQYFKINHDLVETDKLLFSINTTNLNSSDIVNGTDNSEAVLSLESEYLPTYLWPNNNLGKNTLSYLRLNNWLYLFRNTQTAYLY